MMNFELYEPEPYLTDEISVKLAADIISFKYITIFPSLHSYCK